MIRRQVELFWCAVQFLTRLPVPRLDRYEPEWLPRSARWFSLVGQVVGGLSALVLLSAGRVWSGALPALLAVVAGVAVTGAFHEDGLADTADGLGAGLGGGRTRERRLEIMKDSRLGTYGAVALGLALAVKVGALSGLGAGAAAAWALVAAHGLGRAAAVLGMAAMPYAGDPEASKAKPVAVGVGRLEITVACAVALWPLLALSPGRAAAGLAVGSLAALWPALAARRGIGGWTGDVLGAMEQAFETGFLLGCAAAP